MVTKKDIIISGGENIYCSEVEVVIDRHPKVSQVAVVGLPHEKWVDTGRLRRGRRPRGPADRGRGHPLLP